MVRLARQENPIVVAHRGSSGLAPENTFAAFDVAVNQGADMIELDVHPCKDGDLVVMHDEKVDRTTDGTGRISELSLAEMMKLNAAAKSSTGGFEHVPTFDEVLERYPKRIPLMVEVKHGSSVYPGIEGRVVKALKEKDAEGLVELISFDLDCLVRLKRESPSVKAGFIFIGNMASFGDMVQGEVDALHGMWNFVTKDQVDHARGLGLPSYVWTANSPADIHDCLALRTDGIVSNFPGRVREALRG